MYLHSQSLGRARKKGLCTDRDHVDDSRVALGSWIDGRRFVEGPGFLVGKWIGISPVEIFTSRRLATTTASLELDTGVEGRGREMMPLRNGSEVGGRPERREQPRGGQDSSSSNRRMPGGGERVKPGRRVELEKRWKKKLKNRERFRFLIPASSFDFPSLCTHQSGRVLI
jgi:hypothetical protein